MRKEPIIAVILGSLLGLAVAFGVWNFTKSSQRHSLLTQETQKQKENQRNQIDNTLGILKPLDDEVFVDNPVKLTGVSSANTLIGIHYQGTFDIILSTVDGAFESDLDLSGGVANIHVWSFEDQTKEKDIPVVFSAQIENADTQLQAIFGTITDISEETIQIKTKTDQIKQISIDTNTSYGNITGTAKEIKFSDLAIGDYIASLGLLNDKQVQSAKRILVTSDEKPSSDFIGIKGTIKELSSKSFLVDVAGTEYSIDATKGVNVTRFDENNKFIKAKLVEASQGDQIVILGESGDEVTAKRIHIFPTSK